VIEQKKRHIGVDYGRPGTEMTLGLAAYASAGMLHFSIVDCRCTPRRDDRPVIDGAAEEMMQRAEPALLEPPASA
jgi:hypothetical protein